MALQSKDIRFRIDQRFAESDSEEEERETEKKGRLSEIVDTVCSTSENAEL